MKSVPNRTILIAAIAALTLTTASATNFFWDGSNSNDWFDGGNWTPGGGPPTSADNAFINTTTPHITVIDTNSANARRVDLGENVGDTGELHLINGGSLQVSANAPFQIGVGGDGTLVIRDNSVAFAFQNISMGVNSTGTANVTVRDTGILAAFGVMIVGDQGTANVIVRDGATVGSILGNTIVGNQATGTGTVDVTSRGIFGIGGVGSFSNVIIGNDGTGTVTVHDGGFLDAGGSIKIGEGATGVGTVILRGEDSTGTPSELNAGALGGANLDVGGAGTGTLEIHNGALATAQNVRVGRDAGSLGDVLVEGVGPVSGNSSTLHATNDLAVGGTQAGPGGQGRLTIRNNGVVNVDNNMWVWGFGSGDRGTLAIDATYTLNVTNTLNFSGGRLQFLGDGVDFINNATLTNVPGPDLNGMVADVNAGNTATISGQLTFGGIGINGDLTKTGNGTLIITNPLNNYNDTNINQGTLVVGDPNALGLGNANVNTGGTLRTPEGMPLTYNFFGGDLNVNGGTFLAQVGGTGCGATRLG